MIKLVTPAQASGVTPNIKFPPYKEFTVMCVVCYDRWGSANGTSALRPMVASEAAYKKWYVENVIAVVQAMIGSVRYSCRNGRDTCKSVQRYIV